MGANWFTTYSNGKNVKEAYALAVERAEEEYGHQEGYSGHINSSAGYRDVTKEFKASGKGVHEYIDSQINILSKHNGAQAICIQEPVTNSNKIKTQVEHIVTPGTKKWVLKYKVNKGWDDSGVVGLYATKGDAVKAARAHTERTQESTSIDVVKVLEKGNIKVAKVTYKKSSTERDGRWIFFGWASY